MYTGTSSLFQTYRNFIKQDLLLHLFKLPVLVAARPSILCWYFSLRNTLMVVCIDVLKKNVGASFLVNSGVKGSTLLSLCLLDECKQMSK